MRSLSLSGIVETQEQKTREQTTNEERLFFLPRYTVLLTLLAALLATYLPDATPLCALFGSNFLIYTCMRARRHVVGWNVALA